MLPTHYPFQSHDNTAIPLASDIAYPGIMLKYHHSPLSQPDNIRLLRLLSREQNSQHLRGDVFEYNPRKNARGTCLYEALSYVWGDEDRAQSIIIDNRCLKITPNLHLALLHLRDDGIPRIIWVDAVCVNQTDRKEKESQIPLMPEIFARASCVLVWLGPANGESDQALDAIRRAGEGSDDLSSIASNNPGTAIINRRLGEVLRRRLRRSFRLGENWTAHDTTREDWVGKIKHRGIVEKDRAGEACRVIRG
jgi:hypothetical protein